MSRKSTRRRGFGILLGSIRDSCDETQPEFAETLQISRKVIGNVETGTPPSKPFLAILEEKFPERKKEIVAAEKRNRRGRVRKSRRMDRSAIQQRINGQIAANELLEAKDALWHETKTNKDLDHLTWVLESLSRVERQLGNPDASRRILQLAIDLARSESGNANVLVSLWEQYAISFYQDDLIGDALSILDTALEQYPTAPILWYRKGLLYWDEGALSSAYSALATALKHKGSRLDILYIRGQILLEWGSPEEAIVDLDEVLANPQLVPMRAICARSARACAQFMCNIPAANTSKESLSANRGEITAAIHQLKDAEESMPSNPWPFYFRAMCFRALYENLLVDLLTLNAINKAGGHMVTSAVSDGVRLARGDVRWNLNRALECDNPSLSSSQMRRVENILLSLQKDEQTQLSLASL